LPRVIKLPREIAEAENEFLLLSSVMHAHLADLFPGRDIVAYSQFRVTRDADLWIDEEEVKNLRQALAGRAAAAAIRHSAATRGGGVVPEHLARFLLTQFELNRR